MKLVKIGKIPGLMDISEQKVRKLVNEGVWVKGVHYYDKADINFRLFDMEAIEEWVKSENKEDSEMMALADRMVG